MVSVRRLLIILVVTGLIAFLVQAHAAHDAVGAIGTAHDRANHRARLVEQAYVLKLTVERQVTAERGYVITERAHSLTVWNEGMQRGEQALAVLRRLGLDDDDEVLLDEIAGLYAEYGRDVQRLVGILRSGKAEGAAEFVASNTTPAKNALLGRIDRLIERQRAEQAALQRDVDRLEGEIQQTMALGTAAGTLLLALLAGLTLHRTLTPLRDLERTASDIAAGRYDARVPHRYDDEFGSAAAAFNAMAERVAASIRSLEQANESLRQADRYKDELLGILSHELRTPLNFVIGFASFLQDEVDGPLSPGQHTQVARILEGGERMLRLVDELLDFARIRAGRLACEPEPTEVAPLIDRVLADIKPEADRKGVVLMASADIEAPVCVDAALIGRALGHLLDNAVKFTPGGGTIRLSAFIREGHLVVEVADTGEGLPPEVEEGLFFGFRQADMSATRSVGGLGLGLAISKAIVEAHRGHIGLRHREGGGTIAWFSLPAGVCAPSSASA